jgi:hypothetical protein
MAFTEEIRAIFSGDTTRLDQAVRSASVKMAEESKKMASSFLSPWKSIATTLAGYFTYAGIQELGQKMKELRHQAEQFGTSAQFIEGFQKSVKKLGVDPEQATKSLGRLVVKIGDARAGTESAAEAFSKWGVSLYDSSGNALNTEQLLPIIAERMRKLEDPALRASMAFDLFGKSGIQMIPILSQGAEAVDNWRKKAKLSDSEIQSTIDAANSLKVAGDYAIRFAAKLIDIAASLRLLRKESDGIDFTSVDFLQFRAEKMNEIPGWQHFLSGVTGIGQFAQEARIRELYRKITSGNDPSDTTDAGRAEAQAQLEKNREARAMKYAGEIEKLNLLKEKAAKLDDDLASDQLDPNSERAVRMRDELESLQDEIGSIEKRAGEKLAAAQTLGEKEVTLQERIAQLKREIIGYEDDLAFAGDNLAAQAEVEEKRQKAINELKQKELTLAEKIKTAQDNAQKAQADYIKEMREKMGFTVAQLAGEGSDYDAGAGVRGGMRRRGARRARARYLSNISPEEASARDMAQAIQQLEQQAQMQAADGHFFDAQDSMSRAMSLRGMLPDFARPSENPLAQAAEKMDALTALFEELIKQNGGALPVTIPGAAQ